MIGRNESPAEKQRRVQTAFAAKVEILEHWARDGVPDGAKIPRTHAALRRWTGPDGNLATWADPTIDRPGVARYPELTGRYGAAIENIDRRLRRSKKARVGALEADVDALRRENDALRVQNAKLIGILRAERERIALLEDTLRAHDLPVPPS